MGRCVILGGLFHETHTFLTQPTRIADFEAMALNIGQAVIDNNLGNGSPTDGFLSTAIDLGWTILPTIQMAAMPGGTVQGGRGTLSVLWQKPRAAAALDSSVSNKTLDTVIQARNSPSAADTYV